MAESFLWGVATSSHQIEGGNQFNDWWQWEAQGHVEGGVRSGSATDHWNRVREDLRLAADLGLNSYRFSTEWSRLEPQFGQWSNEAFDWYESLLVECERLKLKPMLTLHHFTSPLWLAEQGGFSNPEATGFFGAYVKRVARRLGSRVPLWCTINEPVVLALGSYVLGIMPPGQFAPHLASQAFTQLLRSHAIAYEVIHREVKNVQVGFAHNLLDFQADRWWHPLEFYISRQLGRIYNDAWLEGVMGRKPQFKLKNVLPAAHWPHELKGRVWTDFIGVNYYTKAYVQWRPRDSGEGKTVDLPIGLSFARRKEAQSDLGWAIYPEGFEKTIRRVARYGLPIYVTENGIADHADDRRREFIQKHLEVMSRLRKEGMPLLGYYHWSLLDNFEWIKGFGPRFGLYHVDYSTFERKLRLSGEYFKECVTADLKSELKV